MSKKKMLEARKLIEQKNYAAARKILRTVDHPKAREWQARLDKIVPASASARRGGSSRAIIIVGGIVILVALIAGAVLVLNQSSGGTPVQTATEPTAQATQGSASDTAPTAETAGSTSLPPAGSEERPPNVPTDFPFPGGGFTQVFDLSSGNEVSVSVYSSLSFEELDRFFRDALPRAGYEFIDFSIEGATILSFLGNGSKGNVRVTADGPNGEARITLEMEPSAATSLEALSSGGVGSTSADLRFDSPDAAAQAFIEALTSRNSTGALALICEANKAGYDEDSLTPGMLGPSIPGGEIDVTGLVYTVTEQTGDQAFVEISGQMVVRVTVAGSTTEVPVPLEDPPVMELRNSNGWQICTL